MMSRGVFLALVSGALSDGQGGYQQYMDYQKYTQGAGSQGASSQGSSKAATLLATGSASADASSDAAADYQRFMKQVKGDAAQAKEQAKSDLAQAEDQAKDFVDAKKAAVARKARDTLRQIEKAATRSKDSTALLATGSADTAEAPTDKAADARAALVKEAEEAKEAAAEKARAAKEAARKAEEKAKPYGAAYHFDQFLPRRQNMTAKDSLRQYAAGDVPEVNHPKKPEAWARTSMDDNAKAYEHYMEQAVEAEKAAAAAKKEAKEAAAKKEAADVPKRAASAQPAEPKPAALAAESLRWPRSLAVSGLLALLSAAALLAAAVQRSRGEQGPSEYITLEGEP